MVIYPFLIWMGLECRLNGRRAVVDRLGIGVKELILVIRQACMPLLELVLASASIFRLRDE